MQKYQNQQQQQAWDKEWEDLTGNTSDVPSMYEHFGSYGNLRLRERPGAMRRAGGSELEREAKEYNRKQQPKLPGAFSNIHPIAMNREQLNQYRQNMWEEHSGSNSQMPQYGNLKNIGYVGDYDAMIKRDAEAYKRKQQHQGQYQNPNQQQQQPMDNSRGWTNPNLRNNASPQMRNTSLIPRGATNTPYNTQNTFKPMNPMAFLDNYNSSKSSGSMGPRAQMQNPLQF